MAKYNGKKVAGVVKTIPVAVEVEANPAEQATEDLEKLKVDNVVYGIPRGTKLYKHNIYNGYDRISFVSNQQTPISVEDGVSLESFEYGIIGGIYVLDNSTNVVNLCSNVEFWEEDENLLADYKNFNDSEINSLVNSFEGVVDMVRPL